MCFKIEICSGRFRSPESGPLNFHSDRIGPKNLDLTGIYRGLRQFTLIGSVRKQSIRLNLILANLYVSLGMSWPLLSRLRLTCVRPIKATDIS